MASDPVPDVDLREIEEWKERNQQDRFRMIDEYAAWLRARGILVVEPVVRGKRAGPRRKGAREGHAGSPVTEGVR
ncbi:MAG TPA: hypothetical protein VJ547_03200 [Candidatus Thermoplasmatota archaeon]|nr:hypothetical protein [Candidatus Thermoplasmatota archaeon]